MADISYDTLNIVITANSSDAQKSVKSLTKNLNALDETAKNIDKERILEAKELLLDISKIDFSNVSKGLKDVVSAFKSFQRVGTKYETIKSSTGDNSNALNKFGLANSIQPQSMPFGSFNPAPLLEGFQKINQSANELMANLYKADQEYGNLFQPAVETTKELNTEFEKVNQFQSIFSSLELTSKQISLAMGIINREVSTLDSQKIDELGKALTNLGVDAEKVKEIMAKLKEEIQETNDEVGKSSKKGIGALGKQFANILKYRILRKIIQEIYKLLVNGVQNIIAYDDRLNDSVSKLYSAYQFLGNSIGAFLSPLIQIVEPILTELMTLLGDATNSFAEFFAGVNGQDTFAKAKMSVEDYRKSLEKTKSIGIDELNVIDTQNTMFTTEQVDLSEQETKTAQKLRDLFGKIKELVGSILSSLKGVVEQILPPIMTWLPLVVDIINNILSLVIRLTDQTTGSVEKSLGKFVEMISRIFIFINEIITRLMPILVPIIDILSVIINTINDVLGDIFSLVGNIFYIITPIVSILLGLLVPVLSFVLSIIETIYIVLKAILESIVAIITFDWGNVGNKWKDVGKDIENVWKNFADLNKTEWKIEGYATGGYPQEDGLFFANHTELIGQFSNGQTAVANNEQIIEGIKQGVLEAMLQSGSGGNINVLIDGYEVASIVEKRQNNSGMNLVYGGNINYGK